MKRPKKKSHARKKFRKLQSEVQPQRGPHGRSKTRLFWETTTLLRQKAEFLRMQGYVPKENDSQRWLWFERKIKHLEQQLRRVLSEKGA